MSNDCKPALLLNSMDLETHSSIMNFNKCPSMNDKDSELQPAPRLSTQMESFYTWKNKATEQASKDMVRSLLLE